MDSDLLWFDDIAVIGEFSADDAVARLQSLGETFNPKERGTGTTATFALPRIGKAGIAYLHTGHVFGYLAPEAFEQGISPVQTPDELPTTHLLDEQPFDIWLNRLHIESYPRGGTHFILLDFFAATQDHQYHLNATTTIDEDAEDIEEGLRLFSGLTTDENGLVFGALTVKIGDPEDTIFLQHLETEAFQDGLSVAQPEHPALRLFTETTYAITRRFAKSQRNVPVQKLMAEFPTVATGYYLAVQVPIRESNSWSWDEWAFDADSKTLINQADPDDAFPYNYMIFNIAPQRS